MVLFLLWGGGSTQDTFRPNPYWARRDVQMQKKTNKLVNGGVHTGRKQRQRNCPQICVLASSVDWVLVTVPASQDDMVCVMLLR